MYANSAFFGGFATWRGVFCFFKVLYVPSVCIIKQQRAAVGGKKLCRCFSNLLK